MESKLSRSRVYTGVSYTEWKHELPFHILPVKQQATSSTIKNQLTYISSKQRKLGSQYKQMSTYKSNYKQGNE